MTCRKQLLNIILLGALFSAASLQAQPDAEASAAEERSEVSYLEGLRHFQKAVRASSESEAQSHFKQALKSFQEAVKEARTYELAVYYLGVTYGKLGRYQEAVPHLQEAVQRYERAPIERGGLIPAYQDLAVALYESRQYELAAGTLNTALQRAPGNGFLHFYAGLCHYRLGHFGVALQHLQRAVDLEPPLQARAEYHMGLGHLALDQVQEAVQLLNSCAQRAKDPILAADARRLAEDIHGDSGGDGQKPWQVRLAVGAAYDSNVILEPGQGFLFGANGDEGDVRLDVSAGGGFLFWNSSHGYLRGDYDFYHSRHQDLGDFNLQAHQPRAEAGWKPGEKMTLGVKGGMDRYRLGGEDYLRQLYVQPFAGFFTGSAGYSELFYRFTDQDFRIGFFDQRDGSLQEAGGRHYFLLKDFERFLYLGYQYIRDDPDQDGGNDYQYSANQFEAGLRTSLPKQSSLELQYAFRREDYPFAISTDPFNRKRRDGSHDISASFAKRLTELLQLRFGWLSRFNQSTIEDFEYRRHIGSIALEFKF